MQIVCTEVDGTETKFYSDFPIVSGENLYIGNATSPITIGNSEFIVSDGVLIQRIWEKQSYNMSTFI